MRKLLIKNLSCACILMLYFTSACGLDITTQDGENKKQSDTSNISEKSSNFGQFWSLFRSALIDQNFDVLASVTKFPLPGRGLHDDDPVIYYEKKQFIELIQSVLEQKTATLDEQGNLIEKTLLDDLKEMEGLSTLPKKDQQYIQVMQFQFKLVEGEWTMVEIYIEK